MGGSRFGYKRKPKQPEWIIVFEATGDRLTSDDVAAWVIELSRLPLDRTGDRRRLELGCKIAAAELLITVLKANKPKTVEAQASNLGFNAATTSVTS